MSNKNIELHRIDDNTVECTIKYGNFIARGVAKCHPTDVDMRNNNTGCEIAMRRASIQLYRYHRDILKSQLQALNQLYYSMNRSKHFNAKSYENVMLQRQINIIKTDLDTIKEMIIDEQQKLNEYLTEKEKFYQKIRANRDKRNKAKSE